MTARGYLIDARIGEEDDDDEKEDQDEDEDEWLDYQQIEAAYSAGCFVKRKKLRFITAKLQSYRGTKHTCKGVFLLTDPWWDITVNINKKNFVQGAVRYKLRTDTDSIVRQKLVMMLLTKAVKTVGPSFNFIKDFELFIRETRQEEKLTFCHLETLLFGYKRSRRLSDSKEFLNIVHSDEVQLVLRTLKFPGLMSFLCILFPTRFVRCMLSASWNILPQLDAAAKKKPWIFGFSRILSTCYKLFGIEANIKAFHAAGLLNKLPQREKDALYVYEVLKHDAAHNGQTYISLPGLREHRKWKEMLHDVVDWPSALHFLSASEVTCEERFNSQRNIFLYHNWKAEVDIAKGLRKVLERGMTAKTTWQLDFSSCEVESLRGDPDQWAAAQKVVGSPVVVISGKGGCGKTTVVTQVIHAVCSQDELRSASTASDSHNSAQPESDSSLHKRAKPCQEDSLSQQRAGLKSLSSEQLASMVDRIEVMKQEKLHYQMLEKDEETRQQAMKKTQLYTDLCTDLLRYLSSSADTSMSHTCLGSKILLTAPTGKAAKLLGHKAKMKSCTLHHVIFSYKAFVKMQKEEKEKGKEKPWKYSKTEVLVVDECSLVCVRLFATLLNILIENSPLQKIILLGDIRQLPSIEAGNFLMDVFSFFQERGLGIELKTNHRSESDLIVHNAKRISLQKLPWCDSSRHFHLRALNEGSDTGGDEEILRLLESRPELKAHETSQFVAFRRSDCQAINEICCQHYNQHSTQLLHKPGTPKHRRYFDFRIGDKICFCRNGKVRNFSEKLRDLLCSEFPDYEDSEKLQSPLSSKNMERANTFSGAKKSFVHGDNCRNVTLEDQWQACVMHTGEISENDKDNSNSEKSSSFNPIASDTEVRVGQPRFDRIKMEKVSDIWENSLSDSDYLACEKTAGVTEQRDDSVCASDHLANEMSLEGILEAWDNSDCCNGETGSDCITGSWEDSPFNSDSCTGEANLGKNSGNWEDSLSDSEYLASEKNLDIVSNSWEDSLSDSDYVGSGALLEDISEDLGSSFSDSENDCTAASHKQPQHDVPQMPACSTSQFFHKPADDDDEEEKSPDETVWLCNGEVFFIMHESEDNDMNGTALRYFMLSDRDPVCPRVYCCSFGQLRRMCHVRHSWARTIHTYQGSESDTVVYYVGNAVGQTWKHVYTAVTRGRRAVFLVGKASHLQNAIWTRDFPRRSRLPRRLHDEIKEFDMQNLHARIREINKQAKAASDCSSPTPAKLATKTGGTATDSFLDSDDSWVHNLSCNVADTKGPSPVTANATNWSSSSGKKHVVLRKPSEKSSGDPAELVLTTSERGSRAERAEVTVTPVKRFVGEEETASPKRVCGSSPLDSIVNPVRKKLNL